MGEWPIRRLRGGQLTPCWSWKCRNRALEAGTSCFMIADSSREMDGSPLQNTLVKRAGATSICLIAAHSAKFGRRQLVSGGQPDLHTTHTPVFLLLAAARIVSSR